jgi:2-polyprenyl-3-methyl-5-hydroxy-6-metoxy-1,4-benzoquinol methylase
MDISESMLHEARRNAREADLGNIEFVISDTGLSRFEGDYDFVHSFIVLQHIQVARGEAIVRQLVGRFAPGGVAYAIREELGANAEHCQLPTCARGAPAHNRQHGAAAPV